MASPLMWDVMAVSTYFLLSLLYWYIGLVPDFALLRDCCKGRLRRRYGWLALGWQGTGASGAPMKRPAFFCGYSDSSRGIRSFRGEFRFFRDSGAGVAPEHFPALFRRGAILSGMAMVQLILLGVRRLMAGSGVRRAVTPAILDLSSRFVLALSLVMGAMYLWEHLAAILNGGSPEPFPGRNPVNAVFLIVMVAGNVALPQLFWFRSLRTNRWVIAAVALGVLAGMWMERFWIVVNSLKASLLAANIGEYFPSVTDLAMMAGSVGLFMALYMALVRVAPFFSLCDVREQQSLNKEGGA